MNVETTRIIELLALPPAGPLILVVLGTLLLWARSRSGYLLASLGWVLLYFSALPFTAFTLAQFLETTPALDAAAIRQSGAQAIVVLGGGRYPDAPEYGATTSNGTELERLRYAAWLHRRSGLPIAVIGGDPLNTGIKGAEYMTRALEEEFRVPVKWADGRSRHTFDNAEFAWERLEAAGVTRILLVSHAWHLPRAVPAFEKHGFTVTPAPTAYLTRGKLDRGPLLWVPTAWAMKQNGYYFHELVGMVWYRHFH